MTFADELALGGKTMLLGLGVVFAVLVLLILVIKLMTFAIVKLQKAPAEKKAVPAPVSAPAVQTPVVQPVADEGEIIAAIAAAVAIIAEAENTRLVVRSVRRIGQNAPAWSRVTR